MNIVYTLPGFPDENQLASPTTDGQPDENARENCVATSVADCLTFETGTKYEPDQVHDAVYGQGRVGPMAARSFVQYCADRGVELTPFDSSAADMATAQQQLIDAIRAHVQGGHPVILTMPSQWGTAPTGDPRHYAGSSHVGVACGLGPDLIRVANPWGGFWQDQPDAWWHDRLLYGQVWLVSKISDLKGTPPQGWTIVGDRLIAPNNIPVVLGFANYVLSYPGGWPAWDWPVAPEAGANPVEVGNPSLGGGTIQRFRSRQLSWTMRRGVFETWTGQELQAVELQAVAAQAADQTQIASLNQQIAHLKQQTQITPHQQAILDAASAVIAAGATGATASAFDTLLAAIVAPAS